MLGLGYNNWKMALGNFLIIFGVQVSLNLNDLLQSLNAWSDTSTLAVVKIIGSSLATTLIFYGYNKMTQKKEEP